MVRSEAQDLATAIEFARQRAVMTGRTHQVVIEVERGEHWVEWSAPPDPDGAETVAGEGAPEEERQLDLVPPPLEVDAFVPIPGELGRVHRADDKTAILGVEVSRRPRRTGSRRTAHHARWRCRPCVDPGRRRRRGQRARIEVEPLADAVRVGDAD